MACMSFVCKHTAWSLFLLFLCSHRASSDCVVRANECTKLFTGNDTMTVSCKERNTTLGYTDTILMADQLNALKTAFKFANYCFLGTVDSTIRFRTQPAAGDSCFQYYADSVHVKLLETYKGAAPVDYWFCDTISSWQIPCGQDVWIEDENPGYGSIIHKKIIAMTDAIGSLRRANIGTYGCGEPSGYFVKDDGFIYKTGTFIAPTAAYVNLSDLWIKVPFTDFQDIVVKTSTIPVSKNRQMDVPFRLHEAGGAVWIRSNSRQVLNVTFYTIAGRILRSQMLTLASPETVRLDRIEPGHSELVVVSVSDGKIRRTYKLSNVANLH